MFDGRIPDRMGVKDVASGELKHGTISLIEKDTLVVAISNCERFHGKIMSSMEQVIYQSGSKDAAWRSLSHSGIE